MGVYGDWGKGSDIFKKLQISLGNLDVINDEIGKQGVEIFTSHIKQQDLSWAKLTSETVEKKQKTDVYYDTGLLLESIQYKKSKKGGIFIGIPKGITNDEGVELADILNWLEYGTPTITPRPLVRPVHKGLGKIVTTTLTNELGKLIR